MRMRAISVLGRTIEMQLELLKNEEKQMNLIMFLVWGFLIPIAAFAFVMIFLSGTAADATILIIFRWH